MRLLASPSQDPEAAKPTISRNLETTVRRIMASDKISAVGNDCYGALSGFSRLSIEAHDAGEDDGAEKAPNSSSSVSLDGEGDEAPECWRRLHRPSRDPPTDYDSESEARRVTRRRWAAREMNLERSWQMRRYHRGGEGCECVVVLRPQGGCGRRISMDMEEVRACRDLGLDIPLDFTVEIPGGLSGNRSSSCCTHPMGNGEDPVEIKANLRLWAQAVAFVFAAFRRGS